MSWPKRLLAFFMDLMAWFWLGMVPGWWSGLRKAKGAAPVSPASTAVLFDRRSFTAYYPGGLAPVSPAPTGTQLLPRVTVRKGAPPAATAVLDKLGPVQRVVEEDSPPPVDVQVAERGRVSVAALDSPTITMRMIETGVENPCTVCGKESTSVLLDRCDEHDGAVVTPVVVPPVHGLNWIKGHTTEEFAALLELELWKTTGIR